MYCKLFASLYQGTLRGRSDEILVFTNLLAHCDASGGVDKHFRAIAEETGLSIDRVKAAITVLESPDDESRSPDADGARIQRVDDHRVWGWNVVNYGKYRAIRNEEDRKEQNRLAQERFRNKNKPPKAIVIQGKPPKAQEEAEVKEDEIKKKCTPLESPDQFIAKSIWDISPPMAKQRSSKKDLLAAIKLSPELPSLVAILKSLEDWKNSSDWKKEDGQFIPGIHLWIKKAKWEIEPIGERSASDEEIRRMKARQ